MFTPVESAIGALLLQFSTYSYMKANGRAIGFSSTIYNSLMKRAPDSIAIVAGVLLSAPFISNYLPSFIPHYGSTLLNVFSFTTSRDSVFHLGSLANSITSGLLAGLGTCAGCGCTSGHMLSGLGRLRWRSFVATLVFSAFAIATSTYLDNGATCYHLGLTTPCYNYDPHFTLFNTHKGTLIAILVSGFLNTYAVMPFILKKIKKTGNKTAITVAKFVSGLNSGFLFGLGLCISGMASPSKVLGFLSILNPTKFDPSLSMVILFCILPNIVLWSQTLPQKPSDITDANLPILEDKYHLNFSNKVGLKFLMGNVLFGLGWGLSGICPGPGLISLAFNGYKGAIWITSFMLGYFTMKNFSGSI